MYVCTNVLRVSMWINVSVLIGVQCQCPYNLCGHVQCCNRMPLYCNRMPLCCNRMMLCCNHISLCCNHIPLCCNPFRVYEWQETKSGRKQKLSARQYVDTAMSFVQKTMQDENVFPTKFGEW